MRLFINFSPGNENNDRKVGKELVSVLRRHKFGSIDNEGQIYTIIGIV